MPCFGSLTAPEIVFDIWDGQADAGTGRAAVWGGLPAVGWAVLILCGVCRVF
jgi:hypothetical protein